LKSPGDLFLAARGLGKKFPGAKRRAIEAVAWSAAAILFLVLLDRGGVCREEIRLFEPKALDAEALDAGRVGGELLAEFAKNGRPISPDSGCRALEPGSEWVLLDPKERREYIVRRSGGAWSVRRQSLTFYIGDFREPERRLLLEIPKAYTSRQRLFAANVRYRKDWPQALDEGRMPAAFSRMFADRGHPAEGESVEVLESAKRWRFGEFTVERERNSLEVYRAEPRFLACRFALACGEASVSARADEDVRSFADFREKIRRQGLVSLAVILPALPAVVLLAALVASAELCFRACRIPPIPGGRARLLFSACFGAAARAAACIPSALSSVPLFVSGVLLVKFADLDIMDGCSPLFGAACLAAFNANYFYLRSRRKISEAYHAPDVYFARSLGVPERAIFARHIMPRAIRDSLATLRELAPHFMAESVVVEYVFGYSGLLRSAIQSVESFHGSGGSPSSLSFELLERWASLGYIGMVIFAAALSVTLFSWTLRCLEDRFSAGEDT
jgi:hypothetical protein